jgi:starch synthase
MFVAAEFAPLVRVGGLAAAAAGLVAELRRQGVDVEVVLPDYGNWPLADEHVETFAPPEVPAWAAPARVRRGVHPAIGAVTLVSVPGIDRPHPYVQPDGQGWPDNDRRFFGFCAVVAAHAARHRPDVLHLNDWHTATVLAHLADPPPTMLTIHTLGYQGQTNIGWLDAFPHRREAFLMWGDCNPLAGGIRLADVVVAVSPHYAAEISTDSGGMGLGGLLREKGDRLVGILNGIDATEWNPAADPHLDVPYGSSDLDGKAAARSALLAESGLVAGKGPVIAMVTRLTWQKGVDLVLPIVPYLAALDARFVVLGDGEQQYVDALDAAVLAHPTHVAFRRGYDEAYAHRIFAGADLFVMPSRFEPCGLAQMQAMRYGTLPLVTDVGGLHDTVVDVDRDSVLGTGIVAPDPSSLALLDGLHRAVRAWAQPRRRGAMQRRGMTIDWSWEQPAAAHVAWYERLIEESRQP